VCVIADVAAGRSAEDTAGEGETITADLKPGDYELVCLLPGHYMAGQKLPFTVE